MARISAYIRIAAGLGLMLAMGHGFEPVARGQGAIAYTPIVGAVPSGATLSVTPAVSADRRYVRLSVNPYFNTLNGFTSYTSQLGAVGGGGAGGFAGMNGLMGGGNLGGGMGMPYSGTYIAGDYSSAIAGFQQTYGNVGFPTAGNGPGMGLGGPNPGMNDGFADPFGPGQEVFPGFDEDPPVRRATTSRSKSARQKAVRKATPPKRSATTKSKTTRKR
jgi:hypothetical protein